MLRVVHSCRSLQLCSKRCVWSKLSPIRQANCACYKLQQLCNMSLTSGHWLSLDMLMTTGTSPGGNSWCIFLHRMTMANPYLTCACCKSLFMSCSSQCKLQCQWQSHVRRVGTHSRLLKRALCLLVWKETASLYHRAMKCSLARWWLLWWVILKQMQPGSNCWITTMAHHVNSGASCPRCWDVQSPHGKPVTSPEWVAQFWAVSNVIRHDHTYSLSQWQAL